MKQLNKSNSISIMGDNPYSEPIIKFYSELISIKWGFPYVPHAIQSIVLLLVIFILICLYMTIGVISQISSIFWNLIIAASQKIDIEAPIESSAYAIAIGIYFILFLPFFLVQFPFWLLGWFISKIGFKSFIFIIFLIMVLIIGYCYYNPIRKYYNTSFIDVDSTKNILFKKDSTQSTNPEPTIKRNKKNTAH